MLQNPFSVCLLLATVASAVAQQPGAVPAPAAPPTAQAPAAPGSKDPLQVAFIDADGGRRVAISDAANRVIASDAAGRAKFMETLRAVAAVAPKPVAAEPAKPAPAPADTKPAEGTPPGTTPPAATPPAATPAAAKPPEFADEIKQLMASVVTGTPEASKAALAKLAENKDVGTAALQRLDERGKAIFDRCLLSIFRKRMQTGAMYAGQYSEIANFQPEAGQALLRWAHDAPKEAPNAEQFPSACLRALRDIVPAEQATDAMRETLRKIAAKAQSSNKNDLFVGAVCALHQYGDPSSFDKIKEGVSKRAASENAQDKMSATNMLAELHYQLRDYSEAANHFKSLVLLIEASGQTQGLPTTLYNTACVLSLAKNLDESFQFLERALQADKEKRLGRAMLDDDQDLKNLREDPRFGKMIEQYLGKPASAGK